MAYTNPTASLKGGFEYQDIWAINFCHEWLLEPSKYEYIAIESNPSSDTNFYLDDITLKDKDWLYHLYQAKFKVDSEDEWTRDSLLDAKKSKKDDHKLPSLIKKWAISLAKLWEDKVSKACLITNSKFWDEISKYLVNGKVNIHQIKWVDSNLYAKIASEIGSDELIDAFFNKFEFIFENLDINEVVSRVEDKFYKELWVTKAGFDSLYRAIKTESRKKYTIQLSINQIRSRCEFDIPKQLNEKFEIPSDFQFFNKATYDNIISSLIDIQGWWRIILGKPGTGKSVFLSQLSEDLQDKWIIVIKHHYHINPGEDNWFERLWSERVIEAIKAQFKKPEYADILGSIGHKNSKDIPLSEFIAEVINNLAALNRTLVIIIDGLDHVIRERDIEELKKFLYEIYCPQQWLWIVFWMQPQVLHEEALSSIFGKFKESDQIEIKGLSKDAVYNLIYKNDTELNLPQDEKQFNDLVDKLYTVSEWNPLHLRYTLDQLRNKFNKQLINEYYLDDLVTYSGNIEGYYESLRNKLDDETKTFLLTFISVDFQFTRSQFIDCISSFFKGWKTVTKKFNEVAHLIERDKRQKSRIYHNSFEVFLHHQQEREDQKLNIKKKVKSWLERTSYENLKWAELKKIEYELWDSKGLLSIDKKWLIESMVNPRNRSQILSQLQACTKAWFEKENFPLALKSGYLSIYYENCQDYLDEGAYGVWIESIISNPKFIDELNLHELNSQILVVVTDIAEKLGKYYIIEEIIDILRDRVSYQEYRRWEVPSSSKAIVKVITYDRTHSVERLFRFVSQHRYEDATAWILFTTYVKQLLKLWQITKVFELLWLDLDPSERVKIIDICIEYDLKNDSSNFLAQVEKEVEKSYLSQLYLLLYGKVLKELPVLPTYSEFPLTIPDYGSERQQWCLKFYNIFLLGVIYTLSGKSDELDLRISKCPHHRAVQAGKILFQSAIDIAQNIIKSKTIQYETIFEKLLEIEDLKRPEDRDRLDFKFALKDSILLILENIILLKYKFWEKIQMDYSTYSFISSTPFFLRDDMFELMITLKNPLLQEKYIETIISQKTVELENTIEDFPKRSKAYILISQIYWLYNQDINKNKFIIKAAENLLWYGYHKDGYLFDVLDSIEACTKKDIDYKQILSLLKKIIPSIINVTDYTDWDETRHLPNHLAEFLAKFNQDLLLRFYFSESDKEELQSAEDIFKYLLTSLKFDNEIDIAVASTAIDKDSYIKLQEIAWSIPNAEKAISIIHENLGNITYLKEDNQTVIPSDKDEEIYKTITSDKLEAHLNTFTDKWEYNQYIVNRTKYRIWKIENKQVYDVIRVIILDKEDLSSISGDLLDILYPIVYEFDTNLAFKLLCWAHKNNYWWMPYYSDKKNAIKRWDFVKSKYNMRYIEFFKSTLSSGIPLGRSVEFFIAFDNKDIALAITTAGVDFTQDLMCDLNLNYPIRLHDSYPKIDLLDILFQRLTRASPLVRESAAKAIANLLARSESRVDIYQRLLKQINKYSIEAIIAHYLLPIVKSFQLCSDEDVLNFIHVNDIVDSIKVNSQVIEELLEEICIYTKEEICRLPVYLPCKEPSQDYIPESIFTKYISMVLPPIYMLKAKKIEKQTWREFIDLRSYNASLIAKDNNIELHSNQNFYGNNKNGKFLVWFTTKVSDIYRSSFLRVLYYFYTAGYIDPDYYVEYTLATLPIDLSFWEIWFKDAPHRRPKVNTDDKKTDDVSVIELVNPINCLVKIKDETGKIIIAAEGAIESSAWWAENPKHSFTLIAFAYKINGENLPNKDEIADEILELPKKLFIPTTANLPISFLSNDFYLDMHADCISLKDVLICPLITRSKRLPVMFWQYYRDKYQSFNVNENLCKGLDINMHSDHWAYSEDGKEVIIFNDMLLWLKERYEFALPQPYWQHVLIDEAFLNDMLTKNGFKIWYILKTTYTNQKYSYDTIEEITNYELINFQ